MCARPPSASSLPFSFLGSDCFYGVREEEESYLRFFVHRCGRKREESRRYFAGAIDGSRPSCLLFPLASEASCRVRDLVRIFDSRERDTHHILLKLIITALYSYCCFCSRPWSMHIPIFP